MSDEMRQLFAKIFMWLFVGLLITFGVGLLVQSNESLVEKLFGGGQYLFIWIAELVIAIVLVTRIRKMKPLTATILYLFYTALTGLTFATIFLSYEITSILFIFGVTAGVMLVFGLLGYYTKIDLTKISTFLFMTLIGVIILTVVNVFIGSETFDLVLTIISLILFMIYIAYDIHVIKRKMYAVENEDTLAIYGALQLYVDFINIFLDLLSLFGNSRD